MGVRQTGRKRVQRERERERERRRKVEETRVGSPNEYLISAYLTPTKV